MSWCVAQPVARPMGDPWSRLRLGTVLCVGCEPVVDEVFTASWRGEDNLFDVMCIAPTVMPQGVQ